MDTLVTQSDCNGEDSSGSDGASLLSVSIPAKETDRFGFLLGSGSTVGTDGPPPEVVRQREAKWLGIISQWDRILSKKTNKVKDQCRKGIPASLRARCWPLLCRATERMNRNEYLYKTLDSSPALQSWVDVIERDIDRQFPFHEMFLSRDCHGQRGLFRVLKAYTQFRPDEGYCQGQGPVAAVLLMNMPAEEAFWCLVQISEQYLPGYYSPLLEGVLFDAGVLNGVLRKACPAAYKHLKKHGVEPLMFATDWLMCLYTRHLPFNTLLRVWDLFFCYGVRVLFQVAVVLVRRSLGKQEQRDECEGQMETLERLRGVKDRISEEDDAFIEEVCSVSLSRRDLEKEMEKEMERWKKERPASTFNPWGRCHGYQAAWIKGRETEEERKRKERELGNLSVPLGRSPSSLSPSFLRKKWRRGSTMTEKEGNGDINEVETLEKTCVQRTEDECLNNNRDQETRDFSERRKPPQCTYEGFELNQNRAGRESDPVNAESCSETFEPQSSTADVSGPTPSHGAAPSQGEASAGHTSQSEDVACEATTGMHTPDDPMLASAVVDEEKQSAVGDTVPSEEQRKLPDPQSDSHSQTVHVDSAPSQEHCRSDVSKTDCSFLTGQTNLHGDTEAQGGGPPGQHAEHGKGPGERGDRQDVCVQRVISENGTGQASTQQSGMKEEDQPLSEERVCLVEGIDELRAETNVSAEPSASEYTQNCQTSQVIQESQTASIYINDELSEQMHSDHNSENVSRTSPDSRDYATPLAVEQLVGDTAEQPAASATQQEELPDHVHNNDVLAREPISNEASQEGLTECNPAVAETLGEYPGHKPEMNIVSGQCEDTTEDPCLSAKVPTIQNGQVSVEDTTGMDMEKQEPQTSLQLVLHADTSSAQVQSKEGLPTPEGGAAPIAEGGAAPTREGGAAPTPEGGAAPTPEGGAAPTPEGGAAPITERGAAPTPEGGAAPTPEGGAAPTPEGEAAPTAEGGAAPTAEGGAAPTAEGGAAPTAEGGAAPTPEGGAAPTAEGGAAPITERGAAPTPEGGAAPTAEGEAAPTAEGGAAPTPEGGAAPTPEGGAAPTPEGGAAPTPEGGAEEHEQFIPSTDKNLQEVAEQEPNGACSESKQLQSQPVCSDQEHLRKECASTCEEEVDTSDVRLPNEDNMAVMELGRPAHRTMVQTAEGETSETVSTNPAKEPVEQGVTAELQPVTLTPQCDKCETPRGGAESRPCDSPDPQGPEQHGDTTDERKAGQRQEDVVREDSNDARPSSLMSITETNSTEVLSTAVTEGEPRQTPAPSMAAKVLPEQLPECNMGESLDRPLPADCQRSAGTGDYKALRTCSSRMPDPRKLCEDTFKDLQGSDSKDSPATTSSTGQDARKGHDPAQHAPEHPESPRRFGLFRRLRGDHSKDGPEGGAKGKANTPKMTVPTILIQDFSEQVAEPEAGLTSKERRKRRREQDRRKKEEEKARKKREKELEKEKKERRKPQTRGKSFQVHSSTKADSVVPPTGNSSSNTLGSKRNSAPFFDTYF